MLIEVCKMANMYVKVYGFMIRGFVIETEAVDAPISNRKLVLFAKLACHGSRECTRQKDRLSDNQ